MNYIHAPRKYWEENPPRPWVFLAGSIEMGAAVNWQARVIGDLRTEEGTILNPRRDDWDDSWVQEVTNQQFHEQVEWELQAQKEADIIAMHFDPDTKSPITLLELGLAAVQRNGWDTLIVHCPKGFWRKGNVDIVCDMYEVLQVDTIEEMIDSIRAIL
jgi:hypothetical protein